jgi:glycosyltransferase involved in cell wall biosynthesis
VALAPRKLIEVNRAAEVADVAIVLGNDVTMETYAFSGVPMHRLRISSVTEMDWIERDMESARRAFLWLGSDGLVHKGLDLVLEAFAELPDLDLYVCGPLDKEKDFLNAYRRELHECPNIHPVGWVDVRGPQWLDVARRCVAIVYPSCAEGDPGSVATAAHFGLIPVVTRSASVDVTPETGIVIQGESVREIQEAVCAVAERAPAHLTAMSRAAWCLARTQNTTSAFAARYREVIRQLVPGS